MIPSRRRPSIVRLAPFLLLALLAVPDAAGARKGDLKLSLKFVPQEGVSTYAPSNLAELSGKHVALRVTDGRKLDDAAAVGQGTTDEDATFRVLSNGDVVQFAREALATSLNGWDILVRDRAPVVLKAELLTFWVEESNKAVGSTYNAKARLAFELTDAEGGVFWKGTTSAEAERFGRKRSAANHNEVLSDALKQALSALFDNAGYREAWSGKRQASPVAKVGLTPEALLDEVRKLRDEGLSEMLLSDYISQRELARPFTADDLRQWNEAEIAEPLIQAALARAPRSAPDN